MIGMTALHRKLIRDLIHMRGQMFAVPLVLACGIATYVTMRSAFRSLEAQHSQAGKQKWSVFVIENGRARVLTVEVGHRNASEAEIVKGLSEGAEVILHPANDLKDGARVVLRSN